MNGSHNEFVQLSKNKPTREHNVTLHHSLPITLRYIKERQKTMRSEAALSHRATSNPQSTIHFISCSFYLRKSLAAPRPKEGSPTPHGPAPQLTLQTVRQYTSHITPRRTSGCTSKLWCANVKKLVRRAYELREFLPQ